MSRGWKVCYDICGPSHLPDRIDMMPTSLLATKLHIPATRSRRVARLRLQQRLDAALCCEHCLILVSAPAGFGKTTLLVEWIQHSQLPTAWLSLDKGDNDLARFLTYLSAALEKIQPAIHADLTALLQTLPLSAAEPILTALINH